MQLLVHSLQGKTLCLDFETNSVNVSQIKQRLTSLCGIHAEELRLTLNSKELINDVFHSDEAPFLPPFRTSLRLLGGKGGFGALLRGTKTHIPKNITFDDCRDLNGRRIRHVKNETKLAEWNAEEKIRQQEAAEKKERKRKALEPPPHTFDDAEYSATLTEIKNNIENSVEQGLRRAIELRKKGKDPEKEEEEKPKKKPRKNSMMWTEFDEFDEEESEEEVETPSIKTSKEEESPDEEEEKEEEEEEEESLIDLKKFNSSEELEALGLEHLKRDLQRRGLLIGGTLAQRAKRLFSVKGKSFGEIDPKIKAKK